jgi:hypothetical protein
MGVIPTAKKSVQKSRLLFPALFEHNVRLGLTVLLVACASERFKVGTEKRRTSLASYLRCR